MNLIPLLRGSVNLKVNDVNSAVGYAAIGGVAYTTYQISVKSPAKIAAGCLGTVALGLIWYYTKNEDRKDTKARYEHEERLAMIKHPNPIVQTGKGNGKGDNHFFRPAQHTQGTSKDIEYLISPVVRKDGFVIIYADKGVGKSILAHQMARSIATGTQCDAFPNDIPNNPQKVIYLDAELTKADYAQRGYTTTSNLDCYTKDEFDYPTINNMLEDVERMVMNAHGNCTVFLDCISSYKFGVSLTNHTEMLELNKGLDAIRKRALEAYNAQVSFVAVNHANKGDKDVLKGCQEFAQNATCILRISEVEEQTDYRRIEIVRNRDKDEGRIWTVRKVTNSEADAVHYIREDIPSTNFPISSVQKISRKDVEREIRYQKYCQVIKLRETKTWDEVMKEIGVNRQNFRNWKNEFGKPK